jgi:hypothetical protein
MACQWKEWTGTSSSSNSEESEPVHWWHDNCQWSWGGGWCKDWDEVSGAWHPWQPKDMHDVVVCCMHAAVSEFINYWIFGIVDFDQDTPAHQHLSDQCEVPDVKACTTCSLAWTTQLGMHVVMSL